LKLNLQYLHLKIAFHFSKEKIFCQKLIFYQEVMRLVPFEHIQLFDKNLFTASTGNYKFDTTLSDFGLVKERKIIF
jgi:hypothetical protein